ncbi:MAG: hypothetical protein F6K58_18125 [Symploca sp. SIO2E9]|nr:hypothetical protein [Symploca sp. SIO2E9]
MSEQLEPNSTESEPSSSLESEPITNDEDKENPASTNPIKEFLQNFQGNETAKNMEEMWQGLGAANVFIDARSGGAYFAGEAKVAGDLVGRSQSKRTASTTGNYAKDIAGTILSADLKKVCSVYVQTSSYSDAQNILNNKHVLILWGDSHLGKRTTAIHLLLSLSQTEEILEIDPTLGEEDLRTFQAEAKQVYLIDTFTPDSASKLYNFALNNLAQKLREQSSYLVITVDHRTQLSQELGQYIFQWKELPASNTLLEKHLVWYLENQEPDSIRTLTQQESVSKLLDNRLLPGEVDRLAELLAKVARNELSLEQAVASFSGQIKQQVETWFDEERDLSQRVFMIALSVLSGSKYQAVINASQLLQSLIEPPSEKEETSNSEPAFNKKRSERLKEVSAHLTQGYENTEFGRSPVELVELDNPAFQPAILAYIWNEYDSYRDKLLEWLHELGVHSDSKFEVRIRAAAAAGELSKYAFRDVLTRIIRPWAISQQQPVQILATLALSVPVFEGDLASQVLNLLHNWSGLKNNPRLCWTATKAYGSYVGLRFPDIALRDLFKIAQSGDANLLSAVAESVTILFEAGKFVPNQYFLILNALQDWTSLPKVTLPHQLGLLTFWILMHEAKVPGDSNQGYWPTLLRLAKEDPMYEDIIIRLLRRSLNQKQLNKIANFPLRKQVLEEIHNWLQLVDDDTRLYPIIGTFIFKLAVQGEERERLRILNKLKEWELAGQSKAVSKIFSKISKYLKI